MQTEFIIDSENKWIPDGFHFLGPQASNKRRNILNLLEGYFIQNGFKEVIPPSFDFASSFIPYVNVAERGKVLKTRDLYGKELSPSVDLTIQVVKGMAGFSQQQEPCKVFYTGAVIKDNQKQNADLREFLQLGAEVFGSSDKNTFCNILQNINDLVGLLQLDSKLFIVLGNTEIYSSIVNALKLPQNSIIHLSRLLYQKNRSDIQAFLKDIADTDIIDLLCRLTVSFNLDNLALELIKLSKKYSFPIETVLDETMAILEYSNNHLQHIQVCSDFSLIRDLEYYTGFVFHGYINKLPYPVVVGGEYNHLYEKFSGIEMDACGFAFNLNLLEEILD